MQTVSRSCPDPEALAAFIDQGLSAAEHVQVEAHLAACDDCRLLVARILETQSAVPGAGAPDRLGAASGGPRRVVAFTRTHVVWGTASLVAAAAVLAVTLNVGIDPSARWRALRAGSKLADLAAAVGDERTIEPRLTGGFRYGPLRAAVRSGESSAARDHWTLYAAAGKIREVADRDPSAPNLHALGLAHLVLGQYDEAVRALEDAVAEDPDQPRYHSDLSAAYLARARHLDRPDDLPRALGAAERAVKGNASLLEARFNRALALESLFLEDQARQAWEEYLARDSSSGWANDARAHLQTLQKTEAPPQEAGDHSPPPITETTVEAGLDWLLRYGLPAWADAILANDGHRAAREHLALTDYAKQLTAASTDSFPVAVVTAIEAGMTRRQYAAKLHQLGRALLLLDGHDVAAAEQELREACGHLTVPLSALCDVEIGMLDVLRRQDDSAKLRAAHANAVARPVGYAYVEGRVHRLEGYRRVFLNDYAGASTSYLAAINVLEPAKYRRQTANLVSQLAELYDWIGLPIDAWKWRLRALQAVEQGDSIAQRYLSRLTTSIILARQGEHIAARAFLPTYSDPMLSSIQPVQWVFALIEHANAALTNGDTRLARASVVDARSVLAKIRDFRADRVTPLLHATEAAILRMEGRLVEAQHAILAAIAAFGPERAQYKAAALLESAGLRVASRDNLDAAESEVETAIALLATRTNSNEPVRLHDAKAAFEAVAALVAAQPTLRTVSGLFLVEQLREALDGVPESARLNTRQALSQGLRLPSDTIGYYFLFGNNSLLTWVMRDGVVDFVERPISPRQVLRLTSLLDVQIGRGAPEEAWKKTLADLYDLLIRELPAVDFASKILIIPSGPLYRVPFGALHDNSRGQYMFERVAVRVSPNLAFARDHGAATTPVSNLSVLSIGEPAIVDGIARGFQPLEYARQEAHAVAALYPSWSVLVGDKATKREVLAKLPAAGVVHFAGHAIATSSVADPRLLLAGSVADPTNALSTRDLTGRLNRSRVVLAACETATNSADRASGMTSIAATFLRAGAASVIGTLWKVDDAASEQFFLNVHRALSGGQPASSAVVRAQRACYASEACRSAPATWIGTAAYGVE